MDRGTKAVIVCVLSVLAAVAYIAVRRGEHPAFATLLLALLWSQVANWLGGKSWLRGLPISDIYSEAKHGSLIKTGLALWIDRGANVLFVAAAGLFVSTLVN